MAYKLRVCCILTTEENHECAWHLLAQKVRRILHSNEDIKVNFRSQSATQENKETGANNLHPVQ